MIHMRQLLRQSRLRFHNSSYYQRSDNHRKINSYHWCEPSTLEAQQIASSLVALGNG